MLSEVVEYEDAELFVDCEEEGNSVRKVVVRGEELQRAPFAREPGNVEVGRSDDEVKSPRADLLRRRRSDRRP